MTVTRRFYVDKTLSTYPARSIAVDRSVDANLGVITFTLTSNLTPGLVLNYSLPNTDSTDFVEGNTGTLTVGAGGGATVTRTLNRYVNYSNTNITSRLSVTSPANTLLVESANFVIAPAVPFSASGGTTTTVNGNVIHTFTANSNLTVSYTGDAGDEIIRSLIVGGGGAGNRATSYNQILFGSYNQWNRGSGGGGGAGGVLEPNIAASSFSVTSYPIVVGAGGLTNINSGIRHGKNSSAFGYTAIGGGSGGGGADTNLDGGSGGGSSANSVFGLGTVGQGQNGGAGTTYAGGTGGIVRTSNYGGGGGGNSVVGATVTSTDYVSSGGAGGTGYTSNISGTNVTYAGGGGGGGYYSGSGGTGGGGAGGYFTSNSGTTSPGQNGTNGLGGGGGGAGHGGVDGTNTYNGGNGGSGVAIIAYRTQYRVLKLA